MYIPRHNHTHRVPKPRSASGSPLTALLVLSVLVAGGLIYYFRDSAKATPKEPVFHLLVAADISSSMSPEGRRRYFGVLEEAVETTLPVRNSVTIWTFDRRVNKVWGPAPLDKSRDLWPAEDAIIASANRSRGTYPSVALQEIITLARQAGKRGEPVACLLLADGEDADAEATRRLATELASLSNVRALWVAGAKSEAGLRIGIERSLSPLGERLVVSGPYDARQSLQRFQQLVKG